MKKVAFIHATIKVKNLLHKKSLVLEMVPSGWLSRVRQRDASKAETVLESVIRDVATIRGIDEIVVVTSFSACDDQIAVIAAQCDVGTKVNCYRVGDTESFAITEQNKSVLGKEWPYERFPVYGVWHCDGLVAIAKVYAADVALIVQADAAMFLDCAACEEYLAKYVQKGIWINERTAMARSCAVVNVAFVAELARKYRTRLDAMAQRSRERSSYRIYSLLCLCQEDAGRTDLVLSPSSECLPVDVLYDVRELAMINACARFDFAGMRAAVTAMTGTRPAFVELELVDENGSVMPAMMFERLLADADRNNSVVNVRLSSWNGSAFTQFVNAARAISSSFCMLEMDERAIAGMDDEARRLLPEQVALVQLNATAETDPARIMPFCEERMSGGKGKHFVVLCVRPYDVEKFYSFTQMIDRFVIKSTGGTKHEMDLIDFSPLERVPCKKLPTSVFVGSDGAHAPCRFMRSVGRSGIEGLHEAFRSPEMVAIFNDHAAGQYQAHQACAACREWFIPDVVPLPQPYMWTRVLPYLTVPAEIADSIEKLRVFAGALVQLRRAMIAYVEQCAGPVSYVFYTGMHGVMTAVGDRLCALGAVEKALDIWEEVLRYDPSNEKIHGELDRLLAEMAGQ